MKKRSGGVRSNRDYQNPLSGSQLALLASLLTHIFLPLSATLGNSRLILFQQNQVSFLPPYRSLTTGRNKPLSNKTHKLQRCSARKPEIRGTKATI
jgi:hypothetical protein